MVKSRDSDSDDDLDEELFQLTEKKSNKRVYYLYEYSLFIKLFYYYY